MNVGWLKLLFAIILAVALTGCGHSGGGTTPAPATKIGAAMKVNVDTCTSRPLFVSWLFIYPMEGPKTQLLDGV